MNLANIMKQAQQMQEKLQAMQEKLQHTEIEGQAGGGMVKLTMTVKGEARRVQLDPQVLQLGDISMLEDLLVAAINDARSKAEAVTAKETESMMGGMSLPPGIKLPF